MRGSRCLGRFLSCRQRPKFRQADCGSTLIEFLLVAPLLTVVIGGAISFGAIFYEHRMLSEAAYVGSTAAAKLQTNPTVIPSDAQATSTINGAIQKFLADANFDSSQFDWRIENQGSNPGLPDDVVQITVGRNAPKNFKFFGFTLGAKGCGQSTAMLNGKYSVSAKSAILPGC